MPRPFDLSEIDIPWRSEIDKLLRSCPKVEMIRYDEGEYIIDRDDTSQDTFIILQGACVVEPLKQPDEGARPKALTAIMVDIDSPSVIGEMAYLGKSERTASVRATFPTYTIRVNPSYLETIIDKFSFFTRILCRQFAQRLRETTEALQQAEKLLSLEAAQQMVSSGAELYRKGAPADTLYQLIMGELKCDETGETISEQDTIGGFIDPEPYFSDGTYRSTLRAVRSTIVIGLAKTSRLAAIRNYPELLLALYRQKA